MDKKESDKVRVEEFKCVFCENIQRIPMNDDMKENICEKCSGKIFYKNMNKEF